MNLVKMIGSMIAMVVATSSLATPIIEVPIVPIVPQIVTPESLIREKFGEDAELMIKIAYCESKIQHFANGEVLIGVTNDIGLFQINPIHLTEAQRLGYDVYSITGNVDFAYTLFERNHVRDWYSSQHCWSKL